MANPDPFRTALTDRHERAGAKLAPFAGWLMPLEFQGTLAEHRAVRAGVGAFDVSHLGTVWITGADAGAVVARTFTNDPATLSDGSSQYTLCCDHAGRIVDDLIVYRLAGDRYLAVPNAANTGAVVERLRRAVGDDAATVADRSRDHAIVAVQGPASLEAVADAVGHHPSAIAYLEVARVEAHGEGILVSRTGYTGEVGCELVLPGPAAEPVWDALLSAGAVPCGLGARDTLRLEMGYPLHGNDLAPAADPYEARLGWAVALDRSPFAGQEALRAAKERGPRRRLWGLRGHGRRPPRAGMSVLHEGRPVGEVTSGSFSPTLEVGIGLAYLADPLGPGDGVIVDIRGRELPFEVVRPPFVDRDPRGG